MTRKGEIAQEEGVVRLAGHQVSLKADEKVLRRDMEQLFARSGLTTPTIKEIVSQFSDAPKQLVLDVLSVLVKESVVTKVTSDLYFSSKALAELEKSITDHLVKEGEIDAPRFKELTGLTRKFSIPLLEYFDKIKLTLRVGDKRILRRKK